MLIKLLKGIRQFKKLSEPRQHFFEELEDIGQSPKFICICCSDSRVIPNDITQSNAGKLFTIRNAGNIIPSFPYFGSESASMELALHNFPIEDIIVCGHSDCGAMKALHQEKCSPFIESWLNHTKKEVLQKMQNEDLTLQTDPSLLAQKNVLVQIEHLKTYPFISEKLARKELTLHAWFYEIRTREIFIYDEPSNTFLCFEKYLTLQMHERKNKIIQNLAINYLEKLTHPASAKQFLSVMQLFNQLTSNIQPIWDIIKASAYETIWEELGDFYTSPQDKAFIELVESGSAIALNDLIRFQKNIAQSEGYHKHITHLMRSSFFSTEKSNHTLPWQNSNALSLSPL